MLFPGACGANIAADSFDTRPAALAMDELRHAWLGQLNELIATARELAVSDDTYEFVTRPNIPMSTRTTTRYSWLPSGSIPF
jgi:hypothetical protein